MTLLGSLRRLENLYVLSLMAGEAVLLIILAKLLPRVMSYDAGETLSVWAVMGTLGLGFAASRWLGKPERSTKQRFWLGLAITLIALQIIGAADLSESARIWNMSWLLELGQPSSPVWRETVILADGSVGPGEIDQLFAALMLIPIWFRGVALGSSDLRERSFSNYALSGLFILVIAFALADNGGIEDHARTLSIVWVVLGLLTVALKNASNTDQVQGLGMVQTGASIAATLGALVVGIAIFLLLVTGLVGLIAGSGVVEPVLDAIGTVLRAIITVISYMVYPIFWIFEQLRDALASDMPEQIEVLGEGVGRPLEIEGEEVGEPDPTPGIVISRVLGAIAAILVFTLAALYFFRRFIGRDRDLEEERESLWAEADLMGDLMSGLRGMRERFRRRGEEHVPDAPIAELYYDLLSHAESKGQIRAVHRTPLQFADALERQYRSKTPRRISDAFSTFRYGGHPPNQAEFESMRDSWNSLKDSAP